MCFHPCCGGRRLPQRYLCACGGLPHLPVCIGAGGRPPWGIQLSAACTCAYACGHAPAPSLCLACACTLPALACDCVHEPLPLQYCLRAGQYSEALPPAEELAALPGQPCTKIDKLTCIR